jgi:hypothetical protein
VHTRSQGWQNKDHRPWTDHPPPKFRPKEESFSHSKADSTADREPHELAFNSETWLLLPFYTERPSNLNERSGPLTGSLDEPADADQMQGSSITVPTKVLVVDLDFWVTDPRGERGTQERN